MERMLEGLSEEDFIRPGTIGDGGWSAKDLVGHIASWERLALDTLAEWRRGQRPRIEDVFSRQGGVDEVNDDAVKRLAGSPAEAVRSVARQTHETLLSEIETMRDEEWRSRVFYETTRRRTLAELLGSVLGAPKQPFGHVFAHLPDLERHLRAPG